MHEDVWLVVNNSDVCCIRSIVILLAVFYSMYRRRDVPDREIAMLSAEVAAHRLSLDIFGVPEL